MKFILTSEGVPTNLSIPTNKLEMDDIDPRICEMEILKNRWRDIQYFPNNDLIIEKISKIFDGCFKIEKIIYDDVGYIIFKVYLKAVTKGVINKSEELGITIKVKNSNEIIKNEVKKNNLVFEKRNVLEIRKNEILVFYLSHSK
jgi:hypothetical protein